MSTSLVKRFAYVVTVATVVSLGFVLFYGNCSWYNGCLVTAMSVTQDRGNLFPPAEENETQEVPRLISLDPDIDIRGKWQQEQVHSYCGRMNRTSIPVIPPRDKHFIYDDDRKIIFCYVPKAGCTPVKRVIFLLQKRIPQNLTNIVKLNPLLEKAIWSSSFASKEMVNVTARNARLRSYFTFTVLRNPLERLLSGYLDKITPKMDLRGVVRKHFPEILRATILAKYRPREYRQWYITKGTMNLTVSFQEYIRWFVSTKLNKLNEHFIPFIYLARPCQIKYDFYITFKLYDSDVLELTKRFGGTPDMVWQSGHNRKDSKSHMEKYYGRLSVDLKRQLYVAMRDDLEFYHLLQPEDRAYNEQLLEIKPHKKN